MESRANVLLTNVFGHTHITVSLDDENVYDAIKFRPSFMVKITSPEEVFNRHADDLVLYYPDYHREAGEQPLPGKRRRKRSRSPSERGKRSRSSPSIRDDEKPGEKESATANSNPEKDPADPKTWSRADWRAHHQDLTSSYCKFSGGRTKYRALHKTSTQINYDGTRGRWPAFLIVSRLHRMGVFWYTGVQTNPEWQHEPGCVRSGNTKPPQLDPNSHRKNGWTTAFFVISGNHCQPSRSEHSDHHDYTR